MMNKKYGRSILILLTTSLLLCLPLSAQKSAQVKELSVFNIRFQVSLEGKVKLSSQCPTVSSPQKRNRRTS